MADQIKTITDSASFEKILKKYFSGDNIFLRTKNGDLKIKFFGYTNNKAAFRIPFVKNITENCLISTRYESNTINILAKYTEKQEDNIFIFTINKIQIIHKARGEERKSIEVGNSESKNIIFITNLISYSIIQNSLSIESKKIETIREVVIKEMSQAFNYIKLFFCNEGKGDVRMNYFYRTKEPLFIPNIKDEKTDKNNKKMNFYINSIYTRDYFLQGKKEFISEISIPLLYKTKLPYGYIQANNTTEITNSMLGIVKKFAALTDELMNRHRVFPKSEVKLIVSNISKNGLGIVFKERKIIRYFKENNYVYFDLLLPGDKVASILAMVRNITILDNKIIRIGCSIEEIDAISEVHYEEFLETITPPDEKTIQPEESATKVGTTKEAEENDQSTESLE